MQNRPKPSLPMPSKRTSVMAKSPDRDRHDSGAPSPHAVSFCRHVHHVLRLDVQRPFPLCSASSTDDDSLANDDIQSTPERERASRITPDTSSTGSARETPPQQRQHRPSRGGPNANGGPNGGPGHTVWEEPPQREDRGKRARQEITQLADVMHNLNPCTSSSSSSRPPRRCPEARTTS